jgi:hypothetical protein
MSIFDPAKRDLMWSLILFSLAGLLTVIAVFVALNSWSRWSAHLAVNRVVKARFSTDPGVLRDALAEARLDAPGVAATELLAADLSKQSDLDRLRALLPRIEPKERPAVLTALALGQVLTGAKSEIDPSVGAGDAALIAAVAGRTGVLPAASATAPPYLTTLAFCLPRILADAWARGDAAQVRACAGALVVAFPAHPEREALVAIAAGLNPALPDDKVQYLYRDMKDAANKQRAVTGLAALAPGRVRMLTPHAAPGSPLAKRLSGPDADLEQEVTNAASLPGNDGRMALITRCAERGRGDLAAKVLDMLTDQLKTAMLPTVWVATGNLGELSGTAPDQAAGLSTPAVAGGVVTVHLGNRAKVVPGGVPTVTVDAKPVKVTRIGSLLRIPAPPGLPIVVKAGSVDAGTIANAAAGKP